MTRSVWFRAAALAALVALCLPASIALAGDKTKPHRKATSKVAPEYPGEALEEKVEGRVVARLTILADGGYSSGPLSNGCAAPCSSRRQ